MPPCIVNALKMIDVDNQIMSLPMVAPAVIEFHYVIKFSSGVGYRRRRAIPRTHRLQASLFLCSANLMAAV